MRNKILSVVTATYNDEKYIESAVKSILLQSYCDFEYIIVDDASTDNTIEVLSTINDDRVRVIRNKEREGPGGARNRAIELAQGQFIAIMDGDDYSHPDRFKLQMDFLRKKPEILYLGTGVEMIGKSEDKFIRNEIKPSTDGAIKWMLLYKSPIIHSTSIGKKEIINQVKRYDPSLLRCQDVDLMRKIAKVGKFANLPEILYKYRIRENNDLQTMFLYGKPYARKVHTNYIGDLLRSKFNENVINFFWSVRYPINDDLPVEGRNAIIYQSLAILFFLYEEFHEMHGLSKEEEDFIQNDVLVWFSKLINKSDKYNDVINIFLKDENFRSYNGNNLFIKFLRKLLSSYVSKKKVLLL